MSTVIAVDHRTIPADIALAKEVGDSLEDSYPGWGWLVSVNDGVIDIINVAMEAAVKKQTKRNVPWGFRMFADNVSTSSELKKKVIMAGGELIERGYQRVGKMRDGDLIQKVDFA